MTSRRDLSVFLYICLYLWCSTTSCLSVLYCISFVYLWWDENLRSRHGATMFWSPATLSHVCASYRFSEKRGKKYFTTYSFAILSRNFNTIPVPRVTQQEKRLQSRLHQLEDYKWRFFDFFVHSTLIYLPPLRFHCVGGCWDRNQDCCDFGIGSQTF